MDDLQEQLSRAGVEDEDGSVYIEKYGATMQEMGQKPEEMVKAYSQVIHVKLTRVVSWQD